MLQSFFCYSTWKMSYCNHASDILQSSDAWPTVFINFLLIRNEASVDVYILHPFVLSTNEMFCSVTIVQLFYATSSVDCHTWVGIALRSPTCPPKYYHSSPAFKFGGFCSGTCFDYNHASHVIQLVRSVIRIMMSIYTMCLHI